MCTFFLSHATARPELTSTASPLADRASHIRKWWPGEGASRTGQRRGEMGPSPVSKLVAVLALLSCSSHHTLLAASQPACVARDRDALLQFKAGLSDPADQLVSWTPAGNCCQFAFVTCNSAGEVTTLFIPRQIPDSECGRDCGVLERDPNGPTNLVGTTVSKLLALQILDIRQLALNDVLPTGLSALKHLQVLRLSLVGSVGPVPSDLGGISSLTTLDLSQSPGLTGTLPASLCDLANLEVLDISNDFTDFVRSSSQIGGPIPSCIGNLQQLVTLRLSRNELVGAVPAGVQRLKKLQVLRLDGNRLTGTLGFVAGLSSLLDLNLQGNDFQGPIPDAIGGSVLLRNVTIGGFDPSFGTDPSFLFTLKLSGKLPSSLGRLTNLVNLIIRGTSITGPLPSSLGQLKLLKVLQLDNNELSDNIPASLSGCTSLTTLILSTNQLVGGIPGLGNLPLQILNLSRNALSGSVSASFALPKFSIFDLSRNQLNGQIPPNLGLAFAAGGYLDLSSNFLTGSLTPPSLWKVATVLLYNNRLASLVEASIPNDGTTGQAVKVLDIHSNRLAGKVPAWVFQLGGATTIDISNNALTSSLPNIDANRLTALVLLNISSNRLSGPFPAPLRQLDRLLFLDASKNRFSGSIPPQGTTPSGTTPSYINLGYNDFTGPIPANIFAGFFSVSILILRNNRLTGPIPATAPDENSNFINILDLANNQLSGPIPAWLLQSRFLQVSDLSNNTLTGPVPFFANTVGCTNLLSLSLKSNRLTGPLLPAGSDPSQCPELLLYDVGGNQLSGPVPTSIAGFQALRVLDASSNKLSGAVPGGLGQLPNVQVLDLSGNNLSQSVPWPQLTSGLQAMTKTGSAAEFVPGEPLFAVQYLFLGIPELGTQFRLVLTTTVAIDFSSNSLSGTVDASVGVLKGVHLLDLSRNNFTGAVPGSIAHITDLDDLDLSFNGFQGPIPPELRNFPASDFAGNPGLCGQPLSTKCS